ncbi:hypothetical protein CALCODRAFT_481576 [Calocera cornea HHB12733]|uniref:Uncharacterized protein n=1 Tax=Calocera cornea HHB12733 TaxID=1353952 RepID=A0A165HHY8_9BASI|nr:hypothetical protein CALCODRAFT_481576 [Calocera cornea HHB12733]
MSVGTGPRYNTAILRLQGFLKHARIGIYGNWDGQPETCVSALNAIHLEPGSDTYGTLWTDTWMALAFTRVR